MLTMSHVELLIKANGRVSAWIELRVELSSANLIIEPLN